MEPLEVKTYLQPGDWESRITLKRWETDCQRSINGQCLESWTNLPKTTLLSIFKGWIKFEQKIGSSEI